MEKCRSWQTPRSIAPGLHHWAVMRARQRRSPRGRDGEPRRGYIQPLAWARLREAAADPLPPAPPPARAALRCRRSWEPSLAALRRKARRPPGARPPPHNICSRARAHWLPGCPGTPPCISLAAWNPLSRASGAPFPPSPHTHTIPVHRKAAQAKTVTKRYRRRLATLAAPTAPPAGATPHAPAGRPAGTGFPLLPLGC